MRIVFLLALLTIGPGCSAPVRHINVADLERSNASLAKADRRPLVIQLVGPNIHKGSPLAIVRAGLQDIHLRCTANRYPGIVDWYRRDLDSAEADERFRVSLVRLTQAELSEAIRQELPNAVVICVPVDYAQTLAFQRDLRQSTATSDSDLSSQFQQIGPWGSLPVYADVIISIWPSAMNAGARATIGTHERLIDVTINADAGTGSYHFVHNWVAADYTAVRVADDEFRRLRSQQMSPTELAEGAAEAQRWNPCMEFERAWYLDWPGEEEYACAMARSGARYLRFQRHMPPYTYESRQVLVSGSSLRNWKDATNSPLLPGYRWLARECSRFLDEDTLTSIRSRQLSSFCRSYGIDQNLAVESGSFRTNTREGRIASKLRDAELRFLSRFTEETVIKPMNGEYGNTLRRAVADQEAQYQDTQDAVARAQIFGALAIFGRTLATAGTTALAKRSGADSIALAQATVPTYLQGILSDRNAVAATITQIEFASIAAQTEIRAIISQVIGPIEIEIDGTSAQLLAGDLSEFRAGARALVDKALREPPTTAP